VTPENTEAATLAVASGKMTNGVVDTHSHMFPPEWAPQGKMPQEMFDVDALIARQDEAGVALSIVSDPHIWYGALDPGSIERSREYNDFASSITSARPGRVVGLGSVCPWRGPEHLREAERAVTELGLRGLAIASSDQGRYLDAVPDEFWKLVEDLKVPVFVHPGGTVIGQELMGSYRLGEICGRPLDTTVTLARFIVMGFMERFPGLKLLCAHAGGAICTVADRLDFGHELRHYAPLGPWGEVELPQPPSAYVSKLYLDTVTYGPGPLRLALERVGAGRLLYGSDNPPVPFPLSRTIGTVRGLGLAPSDEARVLHGNAVDLFKLPVARHAGGLG
jgi:aminocarboxymuconate-semialdehyde decarboxylase